MNSLIVNKSSLTKDPLFDFVNRTVVLSTIRVIDKSKTIVNTGKTLLNFMNSNSINKVSTRNIGQNAAQIFIAPL